MVARLDMKVFPAGVPEERPDDPTAKVPKDEGDCCAIFLNLARSLDANLSICDFRSQT